MQQKRKVIRGPAVRGPAVRSQVVGSPVVGVLGIEMLIQSVTATQK